MNYPYQVTGDAVATDETLTFSAAEQQLVADLQAVIQAHGDAGPRLEAVHSKLEEFRRTQRVQSAYVESVSGATTAVLEIGPQRLIRCTI